MEYYVYLYGKFLGNPDNICIFPKEMEDNSGYILANAKGVFLSRKCLEETISILAEDKDKLLKETGGRFVPFGETLDVDDLPYPKEIVEDDMFEPAE